jgi:hypothetical protein
MLTRQARPAAKHLVVKRARVTGNHHAAFDGKEQIQQYNMLRIGQIASVVRCAARAQHIRRINEKQRVRCVLYPDDVQRITVLDQNALEASADLREHARICTPLVRLAVIPGFAMAYIGKGRFAENVYL